MNGEQNLNNPQHPTCFIPRVNAQPFFHGSLFSGIGGFDLAAEWVGWQNSFHCEWNEFGQKILKHYWPNAISYGDITKTDFTIHRGTIDVLTGGFPCQPYSLAGKRKGNEDERHLWPEMLRAIREISPTYIVGENVYGIVNWNGGLVFNEVQVDLENEGYEILPVILPACAVGAPHKRDRIWFVAYNNNRDRKEVRFQAGGKVNVDRINRKWATSYGSNTRIEDLQQRRENRVHRFETTSDTNNKGVEGYVSESTETKRAIRKEREPWNCVDNWIFNWTNFPTQPPICSRNDGISSKLDGITFPKWRNESIKAYGNAIVPQVALQIFKAINLHNESYIQPLSPRIQR